MNNITTTRPRLIVPSTQMPAEDYHAHPSLSCSLLKHLGPKTTPLHFWRQSWMNPHREEEQKDTIAKKFGQAAHMLMLEGEAVFNANWTVKETHNGKRCEQTSEAGKLGIGEYEMLLAIRESIFGNEDAATIIQGCQSEVSMFTEIDVMLDDGTQVTVPARCRHDLWKPQYSADLKFMDEVTEESVAKAIANYGYDFQAHWYPRVMAACQPELEHQNFITIFVEKHKRNPNVLCVAYDDTTVMATVEHRINQRLIKFDNLYRQYGPDQKWPGSDGRIHTVFAPGTGDGTGLELPGYWNYLQ